MAWVDLSDGATATLMIANADLSDAHAVSSSEANVGGLCNAPAWSPDSSQVLFQITMPSADDSGRWAKVDVANGRQEPLEGSTGCYPVWAPDGTSIAWYDHGPAGSANIRITDGDGANSRFVPPIDGTADPCFNAVVALSPGGRYAVVDASDPTRTRCGDGPGRGAAGRGLLVDTTTGAAQQPPFDEPVRSGVFLPDGRLLALPVGAKEFRLLDQQRRVIGHLPDDTLDDSVTVLAYVP